MKNKVLNQDNYTKFLPWCFTCLNCKFCDIQQ